MKRILLFIITLVLLINLANAAISTYSCSAVPKVCVGSSSGVGSVNSSDYWGNWYKTVADNFFNRACGANAFVTGVYPNGTYICAVPTVGASNSTYNSTYATWAYNQTTPAVSIANKTIWDTYNNVWSSTYNSTYNQWAYNQTTGSSGSYNYNQTTPAVTIANSTVWTVYNPNWVTTYNVSYHNFLSYNQSTGTYNMYGSNWYNHTTPSVSIANSTIWTVYNPSWITTYNSTYNTWAYNMTVTGTAPYNYTTATYNMYGQWWYNMTVGGDAYNYTTPAVSIANSTIWTVYNPGWSSTYNSTYATWSYNMTGGGDAYNYTTPAVSIANNTIWTVYNPNWVTTYNVSYHNFLSYNQSTGTYNMYGSNWYNHTTPSVSIANSSIWTTYNPGWITTYNVTYANWAYNQTTPAVSIANSSIWNTYNSIWATTANSSYYLKTGGDVTGNVNVTGNITLSGLTIYNNGSNDIIRGSGGSYIYFY